VKFGSFASLRDALVGREVPCRVRGCDRTWLWSKDELAQAMSRGETQPPKRMCPTCHGHYEAAQDQTVPCSRTGCEGTWVWPRMPQLEHWLKAGRPAELPPVPRGLCASCRQSVQSKLDREVPCRLRGCDGTWTWSAKAQVLAVGETEEVDPQPPKRLCPRCEEELHGLSDQQVPCRVRGCANAWSWTRWSQLEAIRAGKTEAGPPPRMCDRCAGHTADFKDIELPCRVRGCKNTWTWNARGQLEHELSGEADKPKRMCASCLERYSHLEDREVPCKRPGCKNSWTWKRGAQLGKRKRPPPRFCDGCEAEMGKLHDIEVHCENDGCPGKWVWTRAAQLISGARKPPHHMCEACIEFLRTAQPKEIPCARCGKTIHWSKQNQLQTRLGRWVEPTVCGSCKQASPPAPPAPSSPTL
jgi:hypothetical protein